MRRALVVAIGSFGIAIVAIACGEDATVEPSTTSTASTGGSAAGGAGAGGTQAGGASTSSNTGGSTGGAGGGTATGAGGAGGTATGGTGGAGGAGGAGGGAPTAAPECVADASCTLYQDCCSCIGLAPGESPPPCNMPNCLIPKCQELGFMGPAACEAGRCVAGYACDHDEVVCLAPQPACGAGETNSVENGCWGPCVPVGECAVVTDCGDCQAPATECVVDITQLGPRAHCVEPHKDCTTTDCACFGPSVCINPYDTCSPGPNGEIHCSCPSC